MSKNQLVSPRVNSSTSLAPDSPPKNTLISPVVSRKKPAASGENGQVNWEYLQGAMFIFTVFALAVVGASMIKDGGSVSHIYNATIPPLLNATLHSIDQVQAKFSESYNDVTLFFQGLADRVTALFKQEEGKEEGKEGEIVPSKEKEHAHDQKEGKEEVQKGEEHHHEEQKEEGSKQD